MSLRRGAWVRRLVMSRLFGVGLVVVALAGTVWSLEALSARHEQQTADQALSIARVIAAAAVHAHLDSGSATSARLSAADAADLRDDVGQLRRSGQLSALGIWLVDGTPLFQAAGSGAVPMRLTAADARRARNGVAWTEPSVGAGATNQLDVFIPAGAAATAGSAPTWVIGVRVPQSTALDAVGRSLPREEISLGVTMLLLLGGLLWLRRGLLRRDLHARTDSLTGLLNRRALQEDGPRVLSQATDRRPAALLLLDLGEFKSVNDTLGHPAGDRLLQQVAATLASLVRAGDLVVRLGGDEFAVLLTELPDKEAAQLRAEQLLAQLRNTPFTVDGIVLSVDASIGVAVAPMHGRCVDELLQRADVAMYQAKGGHRGTMLYDEASDRHTVQQLELVAELRRALDNGEFVLHYQPKIALPERRVYGVEALVRWQHPTHGLLPPGEFLPLLESTGLIQPLTKWVLREAVHQAASWHRAGMPLKIAVNLSTRSLLSPALPAQVLATLAGADLPPSFLELEITETAIMTNPERAAFTLTQLRARGIDVSIDDFGAGYTSLGFLRILPITALKIDRGLVSPVLESEQDQAVVEAIIELGHRLGLRVIAEGVETEELLARLTDLGCDRAQGYLISRPLPAAALEGWLTARGQVGEQPPRPIAASRVATPLRS